MLQERADPTDQAAAAQFVADIDAGPPPPLPADGPAGKSAAATKRRGMVAR
ncbi:hypothetical protein [Micromonospora sp. RTGN7]|uniref:hypothetical protein n=1 Tax=Micromonospora sp. RTGN7 TaxID=3016526 RepID=UPI0029FF1E35|nr:hypothetical protein [Micromonospora sp. RTGN7]